MAGVLVLLVGVVSTRAGEWIVLYDKSSKPLEARILRIGGDSVEVKRKSDGKVFTIPFSRLSDGTLAEVKGMGGGVGGESVGGVSKLPQEPLDMPEDLPRGFYPMSLSELDEGMQEILARPGPGGFESDQVEAVNLLNVYRFLSGVQADVKLDRGKVEQAMDAANACQDHGSLSHDIGRSTDLCNLHRGQSSSAQSVRGYIDDDGPKNRAKRGHRKWCLNFSMEETGFGVSENKDFFAMWAMDRGGKGARKPWAYPGMGLFPLSYAHGNSWSLYLTQPAPPKDELEVEVFRMEERPEKSYSANADVPGESLPVPFVHTFENAINFEPTGQAFSEPAIYYVRIRGGGVREDYVVEFVDR